MDLLLSVVTILLGLLIPGYCLARRWVSDADGFEAGVYGAGLGLTVVPVATFLAAWVLGLEFSRWLVLVVAAVVTLACRPWRPGLVTPWTRSHVLALAVLALASLAFLYNTDVRCGSRFDIFHPCLHELAGYLQQHHGDGLTLLDPGSGRLVTHVMRHPSAPVLGLEPTVDDQRTVNGAILAAGMALAGRAALDVITWLLFFLVAGAATLAARAFLRSGAACLLTGVITLAAVHGLLGYMVNSTAIALAMGLLVLALLSRSGDHLRPYLVLGFFLGVAVGSRLAAAAWLLALAPLMSRRGGLAWATATAGFLVSVIPWLAIPWFFTGNPFYHPMEPGTLTAHSFLGMDFAFRPLNWPFTATLVTTPGHVLPPLLLIPVLALQSLGVLVAAAVLSGMWNLFRMDPVRALSSLTWFLPITLFLLVQGYVDHEKVSWLLLGAPVLPWLLGAFWAGLRRGEPRAGSLAIWVVAAIGLALLPGWLSALEFPRDTRSYQVLEPQVTSPPRSAGEKRRELGRVSWLPSLMDVGPTGSLLSSRPALVGGQPFSSGHIVVWQELVEGGVVSFPVRPGTGDDARPLEIGTYRDVTGWERRFLVRLAVDAGTGLQVRLTEKGGRFHVEVDPGSPPHAPRILAFHVVYGDAFPRVSVSLAGQPVPVTRLGYAIRMAQGHEPFHDLRLVTNQDTGSPPTSRQVPMGSLLWDFQGMIFPAENQPRNPGIPPSDWRCVVTGGPCPRPGEPAAP